MTTLYLGIETPPSSCTSTCYSVQGFDYYIVTHGLPDHIVFGAGIEIKHQNVSPLEAIKWLIDRDIHSTIFSKPFTFEFSPIVDERTRNIASTTLSKYLDSKGIKHTF